MEKALAFVLAFSLGFTSLASGSWPPEDSSFLLPAQDEFSYEPYTADQLDNLLAPIALYPDPLLAQVLVAATFPDQIDEAARWVRSYDQNGVDDQRWDVSVRAVAHYPTVLNMMDDNLDWTTAVGQAYVYQSTDVMASIQRLRAMARAQGNLVTTPQQEVVVEGGYISIWPANPMYLYVPAYDPSIVFFRPAYVGGISSAFSFGAALIIGAWLNRDCDWGHHRIYYTGWQGGGWIARSRSHIRLNAKYVNPRFSTIVINRRVVQRPVNYVELSRYRAVHRTVNFDNHARGAQTHARPSEGRIPNKIIDRNIPPNQRLDQFRGHQQHTPARSTRPIPEQPRSAPIPPVRPPGQPHATPPPRQREAAPGQPHATPPPRQREAAPVQPHATPPSRQREAAPRQPHATPPPRQREAAPVQRPAASRPQATPAERPPASRPPNAFGRGDGSFKSRAASQRGQQSREHMKQKPAGKPEPKGRQRPAQPGEKLP